MTNKFKNTRSLYDPNRSNVGKLSSDLLYKQADPVSIIDQQRAMQQDYIYNLEQCIDAHKKVWPDQDFFAVIVTKQEKVMQNVFRNYFLARQSCPTPDYDQVVWKYDHLKDDYDFIWAVPDKETCLTFMENAAIIEPENYELLHMIIKFHDGTLLQTCKQFNGERKAPGIALDA